MFAYYLENENIHGLFYPFLFWISKSCNVYVLFLLLLFDLLDQKKHLNTNMFLPFLRPIQFRLSFFNGYQICSFLNEILGRLVDIMYLHHSCASFICLQDHFQETSRLDCFLLLWFLCLFCLFVKATWQSIGKYFDLIINNTK